MAEAAAAKKELPNIKVEVKAPPVDSEGIISAQEKATSIQSNVAGTLHAMKAISINQVKMSSEMKSAILENVGATEKLVATEEAGGLAGIEDKREDKRFNSDLLNAILGLDGGGKEGSKPEMNKLFAGVAIFVAAIVGFFVGFKEAIGDQLKGIKKILSKFKLSDKVSKFFKMIMKPFTDNKITKAINNIVKGIKAAFTGQGKFAKVFKFLKTGMAKVGKFFTSIKDFFTKFIQISGKSSKVFKWAKMLGKVVGKFMLPITILMGAWAAIKGFMKGFDEGGIIGGIKGALMGLIDFLVDAPLNMIKDLVAWLLGFFGFEDAEKALDAFDFDIAGIFGMVFDKIEGILLWPVHFVMDFIDGFKTGGIVGGIGSAFEGLIENLIDFPLNLIKDAVSWILKLFGADDAAAELDAFTFDISGFFAGIWTTAVNWIRGLFGLGAMGAKDEPDTPDEGGWSFMGMLTSVWDGITEWFSEKFSWETMLNAILTVASFHPAVLLAKLIGKIAEWFGLTFSWEGIKEKLLAGLGGLADLGETFLGFVKGIWDGLLGWFKENFTFGAIKDRITGWFGGGGDDDEESEKETNGQPKKGKRGYDYSEEAKGEIAFLKNKGLEIIEVNNQQAETIKQLQTENKNLKDGAAGGGAVAINNAPVTSTNITNSSETVSIPMPSKHNESTLDRLNAQQSTYNDW